VEGGLARDQLVQDGAEAVNVAGRPDQRFLARRLLRGHVAGRAQHRAGGRQLGIGRKDLGQPEIGEKGLAVGVDQDVRGLQVAVHHAVPVQVLHGPRDRGQQAHALLQLQAPATQPIGQAGALDVFHGEVVLAVDLAHVVDLHDVRMAQTGGGAGLLLEPLHVLGAGEVAGEDHLDGHGPLEALLPGLVDHAHAAAPDLAEQLVRAEIAWDLDRRSLDCGRWLVPLRARGHKHPLQAVEAVQVGRDLRVLAHKGRPVRRPAHLKLLEILVQQAHQLRLFGDLGHEKHRRAWQGRRGDGRLASAASGPACAEF